MIYNTAPSNNPVSGFQQPQATYVQIPQGAQPQQQYSEKGHVTQVQTIPIPHQLQGTLVQPTFQSRVYQIATPLNVLGRTSAPADCPACGQRNMTRVVGVVGNTNQSVYLSLLSLSASFS
jgi:lipopolysaccharide-induced tumor necrosis factor-alpha factor